MSTDAQRQKTGKEKRERPPALKYAQEITEIARYAEDAGKIRAVPGSEWAVHYDTPAPERAKIIQGLMDGTASAADAERCKPSAIIYDVNDIERIGVEKVCGSIYERASVVHQFKPDDLTEFARSMQGTNAPPELVEQLHTSINTSRSQKRAHDANDSTGKRYIERSVEAQVAHNSANLDSLSPLQKVTGALKADWAVSSGIAKSTEARDSILSRLSGTERELFTQLKKAHHEYINGGEKGMLEKLGEKIREMIRRKKEKKPEDASKSESMEKLEEELKQFQDKVGMPGTPKDPAIPPEDADEYHTPPPPPGGGGGESAEGAPARTLYEIKPPLTGYYISGRKSYYDPDKNVWSKKKVTRPYTQSPALTSTHTISGRTDAGLKSLPIPNSYVLDAKSLKVTKGTAQLLQDQNGCFYIQADTLTEFSIDFGKVDGPSGGAVVQDDLSQMYKGQLSPETEAFIQALTGTNEQKAAQICRYIHAHHFYPGGGDLNAAQALQYKLRTQSAGAAYIPALDASEYLECYSANTLFNALSRKAGVPTRLIVGYRNQGQKDGIARITESDGHAWSEIWNGSRWIRFDATPPAKPEDKKKKDGDKKEEKSESSPEAKDGGSDIQPDTPPEQDADKQGQPSDSGTPKEAQNGEMESAQKQQQQAEQAMEQSQQQKEQLQQEMQDAESFQDLQDMKDKIEQSDMLDDMKKELEERLEDKKEQMKDEMREKLDQMNEDGFIDEQKLEQAKDAIDSLDDERKLDELKRQLEHEQQRHNEYEKLRDEVMPYVDEWYDFFVRRLPPEEEIRTDIDSLSRRGTLNRRAIVKPRNLIFGTVKNPRVIEPEVKPLFIAKVIVDVSGSMDWHVQGGTETRLMAAKKMQIFWCELFSRIEERFGYIRYSIDTFADDIVEIKSFDKAYNSSERYTYEPRSTPTTVKARLMDKMRTRGGTNMLPAIQKAARELQAEVEMQNYDLGEERFASAMYLLGDGGDTAGNSYNIKRFLELTDTEQGFGDHMRTAIMLGNESQRGTLAHLFGDEHTVVAPNFEALIEQSMMRFDEDIVSYLSQLGIDV